MPDRRVGELLAPDPGEARAGRLPGAQQADRHALELEAQQAAAPEERLGDELHTHGGGRGQRGRREDGREH